MLGALCRDRECLLQETIEVNTVDAFQGREKDMIIFNCVRSNSIMNVQSSLGFLTDERRLNVAITRPRHFLVIVGNSKTLVKSDTWRNLINHCKEKQVFVEVSARDNKDDGWTGLRGILEQVKKAQGRRESESTQRKETQDADDSAHGTTFESLFPGD